MVGLIEHRSSPSSCGFKCCGNFVTVSHLIFLQLNFIFHVKKLHSFNAPAVYCGHYIKM